MTANSDNEYKRVVYAIYEAAAELNHIMYGLKILKSRSSLPKDRFILETDGYDLVLRKGNKIVYNGAEEYIKDKASCKKSVVDTITKRLGIVSSKKKEAPPKKPASVARRKIGTSASQARTSNGRFSPKKVR